jgi:hypothetical protein
MFDEKVVNIISVSHRVEKRIKRIIFKNVANIFEMLTTFAPPKNFRCQHFSPNILFLTVFRSTIFHPTFSKNVVNIFQNC